MAQGMANKERRQFLSLVEPLQGFRQICGIHMYLTVTQIEALAGRCNALATMKNRQSPILQSATAHFQDEQSTKYKQSINTRKIQVT